jgi:AraC-like DNA-binding protein
VLSPDLLQRLCHARRRLQRELESPVPVAQLAREAGLSTPHFITQFGAVFGETPLQCRTRARLDRACELLAADDEPASQIALALGFASQGSLSRLFTRRYGVPPRIHRQRGSRVVAPAGCIGLMNLAHAAT